jgi:hypothetical protein
MQLFALLLRQARRFLALKDSGFEAQRPALLVLPASDKGHSESDDSESGHDP